MQLLSTLQTVARAITFAAAASPQPTPIPPPTGNYYVGKRKLAVARTNPNNFTLPTNLTSDMIDRLDLVEKALGTKVNRHLLGTFGHSAGVVWRVCYTTDEFSRV